jgi:DNA-binding response OmpR family regulator
VPRVLVVDDDRTVGDVVARYLQRDGYAVDQAHDGEAALALATSCPPDLVILDLMLPKISGLEVCRRLREIGPIPVIMLTARSDEEDRVVGLEIGADDYVTKPFSPRELVLRVNAVLRRAHAPLRRDDVTLSDGSLVVDTAAHEASLDGKAVMLTAREFDLLVFFMRNPRTAFSREQLLERVWDWTFGDASTVTVHVRRLREKIEADPSNPVRLVTVWGVGYRFEPAEPE